MTTNTNTHGPWNDTLVLHVVRHSEATDPREKLLSIWLADNWDLNDRCTTATSKDIQKALGFGSRTVSTLNKELKDWDVVIEPGQVPRYYNNFLKHM